MSFTAESSPAVALTDYTVRYGSHVAVHSATFSMPRGACGLLGKNGAGKSSILKAVLGLIRPAGGTGSVLGLEVRSQGAEVRDRIGYMPEKETSLPGLSGLDMVILAGGLSGLPAAVAKQRAHEVLWLVGLEESRYRKVEGYSLGMKQRVKLATALVHDPELLFLDEPTNGLDPKGRQEILELLGDLVQKKGKSLILSSHILPDVEEICDHVVLLDEGRVIGQGPLAELTKEAGRYYTLRVQGDTVACHAALDAAGLLREVPEQAGTFRVYLAADQQPDVVFHLVQQCASQVRLLEPQRRTLSEAFLDAVAHPEAGAS
ncbi:MAG: ABC transporter ATP-binding protein [Planctomycetota bacterium]|nr:ABC transporter ATP-binding protein [Planctomycetota bacterium]